MQRGRPRGGAFRAKIIGFSAFFALFGFSQIASLHIRKLQILPLREGGRSAR